ncbi:MAG: hypothetical protein QG570_759 [Patescibacteria group bacterium]|nr:hypothetical protein [Patescibacteria group bacterium]
MVDAKYKSYQDSDLDLIRTYKDHPVPKYGVEEAEVILSTLDIELPSGMAAFIAMLGTLISPKSERYGTLNNFNVTDARNVGICSDVEVFLKSIFPWKGHGPEYGSSSPQTTVYKDTNNNPIFLEKTKGFGNPSAINLVPITINGVYIAPGYIHGIQIGRDNLDQQISKSFGGVQLTLRDINTISGINPRRATVFVSSDENERQSAFHNIYGNSSCHGIYLEEFEKYSRDIIKFVE